MTSRRKVLKGGAAMLGGATLGPKVGRTQAPDAERGQALASVVGPIEGGRYGRPFAAYFGDIGERGYVEEEYFVSGDAQRYEARGALTPDGKWTFVPAGSAPFTTRILVRRPKDPAKFNGTVIVEWANVSMGLELSFADSPSVYDGMAHIIVSAQQVGLHGFPGPSGGHGLRVWDAERYGQLTHPGDSYCYDIYSQVARLIGQDGRKALIDPMGGLPVTQLIAVGASQSALCLTGYFNAIQPRDRLFDAFMIVATPGGATGYDDKIYVPPDIEMSARFNSPVHLRDDLATPAMVLNSEAEALTYVRARQPDTATFRCWEVAGAAHSPPEMVQMFDAKLVRDGLPGLYNPQHHWSNVTWGPSYDAALKHMRVWLQEGTPPPSQPPINVIGDERPIIDRDVFGNATGGVRLPDLEAPIARYQGSDERPGGGGLLGLTEPFTPEILSALYPTRAAYVAQTKAAAQRAEAAGVILPYRTREYISQAEDMRWPVES